MTWKYNWNVYENSRNFVWGDNKRQNSIGQFTNDMFQFHCIHVHSFQATILPTPNYVCKQTPNHYLACLFLNNSLERFIVWRPKLTFNADSIAFGSLQLSIMKMIFGNFSMCIQKENYDKLKVVSPTYE